MTSRVRLWLIACCGIVCASPLRASEDSAGDVRFLHAAGIATDDRSLLDFFRKQTADAATLRRTQQLIEKLGSDSFPIREQASDDLLTFGPVVLPLLQERIRRTTDLEVRRRSREAVQQLQSRWPASLTAAAARLLAVSKPSGTAETLLAFLPGPYDESVNEEIQTTLVAVARGDSIVNPNFIRALASPVPAQRTAAAVTLCRIGAGESWPAIRKLLHDPDASVRLQVASELAGAGERQAVPVLIDLLAQLPVNQAEFAEELLYRLAGPNAPPTLLGHNAAGQRKCRDDWQVWWRAHGGHVEMTALKDRERQLGYTLLVLLHDKRVVEWDRHGKVRWQINGLAAPLDAEVLPCRRVLIAEHDTKRVTERNLQGEILWQKKMPEPPIHAQRLPDGGTFIATRKQVVEVDRSGQKEHVRYRASGSGIITARRFRDGRIGCIDKGSYFELSATGQELRRFAAPAGVFTTNSLTLLPNGHLLITSYGGGTVQEYDRAGKIVWEVKLGRPLSALRLPGGHTLVSTQDMVLIEYDRAGKEIVRRAAPGHPCQIHRR